MSDPYNPPDPPEFNPEEYINQLESQLTASKISQQKLRDALTESERRVRQLEIRLGDSE